MMEKPIRVYRNSLDRVCGHLACDVIMEKPIRVYRNSHEFAAACLDLLASASMMISVRVDDGALISGCGLEVLSAEQAEVARREVARAAAKGMRSLLRDDDMLLVLKSAYQRYCDKTQEPPPAKPAPEITSIYRPFLR